MFAIECRQFGMRIINQCFFEEAENVANDGEGDLFAVIGIHDFPIFREHGHQGEEVEGIDESLFVAIREKLVVGDAFERVERIEIAAVHTCLVVAVAGTF